MSGTRADRNRAVVELDLTRKQAADIDQACGARAATLHIAKERLATGEQHRAVNDCKPLSFGERWRVIVDEVTHVSFSCSMLGHCPRPGRDGGDDVVIAGTATDVALQRLTNRRFVGRTEASHYLEGHHHHPRRA